MIEPEIRKADDWEGVTRDIFEYGEAYIEVTPEILKALMEGTDEEST